MWATLIYKPFSCYLLVMDVPFQTTFLTGPRELWPFVHCAKPPDLFQAGKENGYQKNCDQGRGEIF